MRKRGNNHCLTFVILNRSGTELAKEGADEEQCESAATVPFRIESVSVQNGRVV